MFFVLFCFVFVLFLLLLLLLLTCFDHSQLIFSFKLSFRRRRDVKNATSLDEESSRKLFRLFDLNKDGQIKGIEWFAEGGKIMEYEELVIDHDLNGSFYFCFFLCRFCFTHMLLTLSFPNIAVTLSGKAFPLAEADPGFSWEGGGGGAKDYVRAAEHAHQEREARGSPLRPGFRVRL